MRCPICKKEFSQDDPGVAFPFCSERCRQIDAKRWFNEEYSILTLNVDQLEREIAEGQSLPPDDEDTSSPDDA